MSSNISAKPIELNTLEHASININDNKTSSEDYTTTFFIARIDSSKPTITDRQKTINSVISTATSLINYTGIFVASIIVGIEFKGRVAAAAAVWRYSYSCISILYQK